VGGYAVVTPPSEMNTHYQCITKLNINSPQFKPIRTYHAEQSKLGHCIEGSVK